MAKNNNLRPYLIIQATLELRFKTKYFSLFDKKGDIADTISKTKAFEKIKISDDRVDIATDNLDKKIFISIENSGTQYEAIGDFDTFASAIDSYYQNEIITELIQDKELLRIGLRAKTYFSNRNMNSLDKINKALQDNMLSNQDIIENAFEGKITDSNYIFDLNLSNKKAKISIAPITKEQALTFFENTPLYKNSFRTENAAYIDIDLYNDQTDSLTVKDSQQTALEFWHEIEIIYDKILNSTFGQERWNH
jgi:hypothetical protein